MNHILRFVLLFVIALVGGNLPLPGQDALPTAEELVKIQLPSSPIAEVLNVYEMLSGKRLIRDANLTGPNLSIVVADSLPKSEAISLLEAALILNGFTLVPVDGKTVKVLGSAKHPSSEGVVLYAHEAQLPPEDRIVSYFMPLRYLPATEAVKIFTPYATVRPFGSIIAIPNANAVVITENTPLIRRLISLQKLIDIPGQRMLTEFVSLKRADAERVAELVSELVAEEAKEGNSPTAPAQPRIKDAPATAAPETLALSLPTPPVQIKADPRTNRIVVLAPESRMPFIRKLIEEMDVAVDMEEPLERRLKFVSAGDVLPILANILAEGGKDDANAVPQARQASPQTGSAPGSAGGGGGSGLAGKPDKLQAPNENTLPLSLIVGKSRIIADQSANKIILIGPPEARAKAERVLDMMDERPKQIYLATIIGQLTLGNGIEAGVNYLVKFDNFRMTASGQPSGLANLLQSRAAGVDVLPDTENLLNGAVDTATQLAQTAIPLASGLTLYGTIADTLDVYVHALASTNRFRVLSRPMIFTSNNKKAVILSGQQVPVPQNTLTTALNTDPNGSSVTATIDYKDVILKLEVIPLVNSNDEVTLTIAQQNDTLEGSTVVADNEVPIIGTQELTTTVTVRNREIIVLGGLITNEKQDLRTGIPFLKDVPGLGYFFGSTKKDVTRRELIVFIQPIIINDTADMVEANRVERSLTDFQGDLYQDLREPPNSKPPRWKRDKAEPVPGQ